MIHFLCLGSNNLLENLKSGSNNLLDYKKQLPVSIIIPVFNVAILYICKYDISHRENK